MNPPTMLADPKAPPAPTPEQQPAFGPESTPNGSAPNAAPAPTPVSACANCGSPMDGAQDWCMQCGAGAPGSLATRSTSWRSAATILGATAVLAIGAAAAAYAALNKTSAKPRSVTTTVAQAATPATAPPVTPTPTTPKTLGGSATVQPAVPLSTVKPPKIPLTAVTPKSTVKATTPLGTTTTPASTTPTESAGGTTTPQETQPAAILLDTNAAATYNPYNYPASKFGDPSLAIDGDTSTGWTAQVDPAVAPKMAEGLVIDLKTPHRISAVAIVTSTPGMTVQIYGANGKAPPTSITDPAWLQMSPSQVLKQKHVRIKLRNSTKAVRFLTLWIGKAPAASIGTAAAPGHVTVDEFELFPA